MTELKTLRDIENKFMKNEYPEAFETSDIWNELRVEAIKWIEDDRKIIIRKNEEPIVKFLEYKWMNRFNITEEDLKGEQEK